MFNVASHAGLSGSVSETYVRFKEAGFSHNLLPNDEGWMPKEAFPDQEVGRIWIRDELGRLVVNLTGREASYSKAQLCNFMRQGRVLEHCDWRVNSVPTIYTSSLSAIAGALVQAKARRNRTPNDANVHWVFYDNSEQDHHPADDEEDDPEQGW